MRPASGLRPKTGMARSTPLILSTSRTGRRGAARSSRPPAAVAWRCSQTKVPTPVESQKVSLDRSSMISRPEPQAGPTTARSRSTVVRSRSPVRRNSSESVSSTGTGSTRRVDCSAVMRCLPLPERHRATLYASGTDSASTIRRVVVILCRKPPCPATPRLDRRPMKRRLMTRLHTQIESDGPVATVRLIGGIDQTTICTAETTVTEVLTGQPDALLLDLSGVSCAEPAALLAFAALAHRASLWPGVPVILHAPDPVLRSMLTGQAVDRAVAVCPDRAAALALARCAPTPFRLREQMRPVPGVARRSRDLATEACLIARIPELVASASIVTSELVANAVRHAGTPFELTLIRT